MTYYDHATAMAFELDRWSKPHLPQCTEREAIACSRRRSMLIRQQDAAHEQRHRVPQAKRASIVARCASMFRSLRFTNTLDTP